MWNLWGSHRGCQITHQNRDWAAAGTCSLQGCVKPEIWGAAEGAGWTGRAGFQAGFQDVCHWLGYIHAGLGFWGSVIQVFKLQTKGVAFGGEPFLHATVRAPGEPDKAEIVNVLLQGIIQCFLSKDAVSSKFLSQRCCIWKLLVSWKGKRIWD